jgi:hypothetical protein
LQPKYVMMFLMDYPSSSHHKLNHRTRHLRPDRVLPFITCLLVRPAIPYVSIYNASCKTNRRMAGLRFLQSCASGSWELKHRFGLCFATSASPIYTCIHNREGDLISSTLTFLPFHFPTTQHHGACEEDGCQWCLGLSSQEDHLHYHRQGGRDFEGSARRPS